MDIEYLRTFCTTVELGSMARAAVALGMSQPAVSHEIRSLESHLGVRLLDRTPEGVVPTPYGTYAYETFAALVQRCAEMHDAVIRLRDGGGTTLTVGASAYPGGYLVPFAVRPFALRHRDVRVELRVGATADILGLLRAGTLDLAIIDGHADAPDLVQEVLAEDAAVATVSADAAQAGIAEEEWTVEAFVRLPHVLCTGAGTANALFAFLASREIQPGLLAVAARVESLEAAKALVQDGVGVGVFPSRAVLGELQAETLRAVDVRGLHIRVPVVEAHVRGRHVSPLADAFVEQVRRVAGAARRRQGCAPALAAAVGAGRMAAAEAAAPRA